MNEQKYIFYLRYTVFVYFLVFFNEQNKSCKNFIKISLHQYSIEMKNKKTPIVGLPQREFE